jgi:hypothetical protein
MVVREIVTVPQHTDAFYHVSILAVNISNTGAPAEQGHRILYRHHLYDSTPNFRDLSLLDIPE